MVRQTHHERESAPGATGARRQVLIATKQVTGVDLVSHVLQLIGHSI